MKKKLLGMLFSIASLMLICISSVAAEEAQKPDYAKNGVCTVDTNDKLVEAANITWKNNKGNDKSCDEIIVKNGISLVLNEELNLGDKLLHIGYEDDNSATLTIGAGGKITYNDGGIYIDEVSTLTVAAGGEINGKTTIMGDGQGTGKLIVTGKVNISGDQENDGILNLDVEVSNGGEIAISNMNGGIDAEDNKVVVNGGTITVTNNNTYGILGKIITEGNAKVVSTGNKKGLRLKADSSFDGTTILTVTGNEMDIALNDTKGGVVTIGENAKVTVGSIAKNGNGNKAIITMNGDGVNFIYTSAEDGLIIPINGTISTEDLTVRYADHDIVVDDNTLVTNTSDKAIKVRTADMKEGTGVTIETGKSEDIQLKKIIVDGKEYTVIVGTNIEDINLLPKDVTNITVENPDTGDSIITSVVVSALGLIGLIGFSRYLATSKKKEA